MRKYLLFLFSLLAWNVISHAADGTVLVIDKIAPKNGAFVGVVDSSQTLTNVTNFNNNLSASDNTVQKALDTLDNMTISGGGGGSSTLAVGTGTASNFTTNVTSPTAVISFLGTQFGSVANGTTNFMTIKNSGVTAGTYGSATQVSSVTIGADGRVTGAANVTISLTNSNLQAGTYSNVTVPAANVAAGSLGASVIASSIAASAVQDASIVGVSGSKITGTATIPNAAIDGSSVTKQGVLIAGTNITLTPAAGSLTISAASGGGGGSSTLAVGTGTAANFTTNITSPTAVISFLGTQFGSVASGTTNFMTIKNSGVTAGTYGSATQVSSVTVGADGRVTGAANVTISLTNSNLQAGTYSNVTVPAANVAAGSLGASVIASSIAVNAVQDASIVGVSGTKITGTATIPNAAINGSSITKAGVLVAGTNITITPGSGITTISASGGGSGSSIYPASSTAFFPSGLHVSTISITDSQGGANKARVFYNDFGAGGSEIHLNMDTGSGSPAEQLVIGSTNTSNKNIVFNGVNTGIAGFNDGNETLTWNKNLRVDQALSVGSITVINDARTFFDDGEYSAVINSAGFKKALRLNTSSILTQFSMQRDNVDVFQIEADNSSERTRIYHSVGGSLSQFITLDGSSPRNSVVIGPVSSSLSKRIELANSSIQGAAFGSSDARDGLVLNPLNNGSNFPNVVIGDISGSGSSSTNFGLRFYGATNHGTLTWNNLGKRFDLDSPIIFQSSTTFQSGIRTSTLTIASLPSQGCIGTDASGNVQAGSCSGGGGATIWSKLDGSALDNVVSTINVTAPLTASSSPSGQINIGVLSSSVTLQGNTFNTGSNLVQLSGGLIPNSLISGSSVTKQGVITAGSGISVTNGSGIVTIAATGSGITGTTTTISMTIDGQGSAIVAGSTRSITVPFQCVISSWSVVADASGSLAVHLASSTFNNYPTITNITGAGNGPSLSSQSKRGAAVSGWTQTTIDAGSVLAFVVDSASTVKWATIVLWVIR